MADNNNPYGTPYGAPYGGNYGNVPYGNAYGPYGNAYGQTGGKPSDDDDDEEGSNFNIMEWVFRFLHYWYLFVLGAAIAMGLAYLKNRSWMPQYLTSGTLIINETGATSNQNALMQGFGVDIGYRNVQNQVIMMGSYDLMSRVCDSLPALQVDYLSKGRFKTRYLYDQSPIIITPIEVKPEAYDLQFELELFDNGTYEVSLPDVEGMENFKVNGKYAEEVSCQYFSMVMLPSEYMVKSGTYYFVFRSKESLIADFSSRLHLDFVTDGASVLTLSLTSEVPNRDRDFIDKLCQIYLLQSLERKNNVAEATINFINSQLRSISDSLTRSESAMTAFRQSNQIVDMSSKSSELLGHLNTYEEKNLQLRLQRTYMDYLENYLKRGMDDESIVAPSTMGLQETALSGLVAQLNDLILKRSELSDKNVYYAKYTKDIANVKTAIHEVLNSMRASLKIEQNDLNERYAQTQAGVAQLPEKELKMQSLKRNYDVDNNYYTFFLQKRAEAEIQLASNQPDNDILDKARTQTVTNGGEQHKTTMSFLMIGLLIPAAFVVLRFLLDQRIMSPRDVQRLSNYKMIGAIRHTNHISPVIAQLFPRSSYTEQLRAIRTRIEFIAKRKDKIVISITSSQSGDGKTYISTNLAALYGMSAGKKTILLDFDIRKPNIHQKLDAPMPCGVTNYLIGECTYEELIQHDPRYNFDFICAGTVPPNPGELVRMDEMSALIDRLKEEYDYVIIDTSPVGLVADAYSYFDKTDVNLFVVRCKQTQRSFASNVMARLEQDHVPNIYTVFSDVPYQSKGYNSYAYQYSYGYGGSYGYGYGYGVGSGSSRSKRRWNNPNNKKYYSDDENVEI